MRKVLRPFSFLACASMFTLAACNTQDRTAADNVLDGGGGGVGGGNLSVVVSYPKNEAIPARTEAESSWRPAALLSNGQDRIHFNVQVANGYESDEPVVRGTAAGPRRLQEVLSKYWQAGYYTLTAAGVSYNGRPNDYRIDDNDHVYVNPTVLNETGNKIGLNIFIKSASCLQAVDSAMIVGVTRVVYVFGPPAHPGLKALKVSNAKVLGIDDSIPDATGAPAARYYSVLLDDSSTCSVH